MSKKPTRKNEASKPIASNKIASKDAISEKPHRKNSTANRTPKLHSEKKVRTTKSKSKSAAVHGSAASGSRTDSTPSPNRLESRTTSARSTASPEASVQATPHKSKLISSESGGSKLSRVKPSRADGFAIIREHHQREVIEDYLEAILDLTGSESTSGYSEVRMSDLSDYFGVSKATVNQHIKRLEKLHYVSTKPYRAIFLTPKGNEIAERSMRRHQLVIEFLVEIGVPIETAHFEAEGIEHHLSDGSLLCLEKWLKNSRR